MLPTKEVIQTVLARDDRVGMHALGRALVHLLGRQTITEAQSEITIIRNETGFAANDAKKGSGMAKFYERRGYLTPKQIAYWQRPCRKNSTTTRIGKYWYQLWEEAIEKAGKKNCQIAVDIDLSFLILNG